MKNKLYAVICAALLITSLAACGGNTSADAPQSSQYKNQLNNFFDSITTINNEINELNPEDSDSISELFVYLDELEEQFKYFADIDVPADYKVTESLADEAYDYMVQANDYFEMSFADGAYNEYTYAAGMECYRRANKRVQYVISIIHGQLPEDENVSFE